MNQLNNIGCVSIFSVYIIEKFVYQIEYANIKIKNTCNFIQFLFLSSVTKALTLLQTVTAGYKRLLFLATLTWTDTGSERKCRTRSVIWATMTAKHTISRKTQTSRRPVRRFVSVAALRPDIFTLKDINNKLKVDAKKVSIAFYKV